MTFFALPVLLRLLPGWKLQSRLPFHTVLRLFLPDLKYRSAVAAEPKVTRPTMNPD
ncbi:MAG TPA: hypothetical protein VE195_00580 [Acidobacteriaceae bacterium]|nr:hypothetical protein [Acidobacteriaceae bacterium]